MEIAVPHGGHQAVTAVEVPRAGEETIADHGSDTVLCALADMGDPGAREFHIAGRAPMFVVRAGDRVFGYRNRCPHMGTTLEWKKDTFLTWDLSLIQCSVHGAQFTIEDGLCVAGPCPGAHLEKVAVRIEEGVVMLDR